MLPQSLHVFACSCMAAPSCDFSLAAASAGSRAPGSRGSKQLLKDFPLLRKHLPEIFSEDDIELLTVKTDGRTFRIGRGVTGAVYVGRFCMSSRSNLQTFAAKVGVVILVACCFVRLVRTSSVCPHRSYSRNLSTKLTLAPPSVTDSVRNLSRSTTY